jgi:stage V sporulation protein D (sporulation-specific penicillin-binding protein)
MVFARSAVFFYRCMMIGGHILAGLSMVIKRRLLFLLFCYFIIVLALLGRVAYIQIVQGDELQKKAFQQQQMGRAISPARGAIYDRNGRELAISASVETIAVNPNDIKKSKKSPYTIAAGLSEILDVSQEYVLNKLSKNTQYEYIKRRVDKEVGNKVREWIEKEDIKGIYIDEDTKRFYPNRNLACHIIGFTDIDNRGIEGMEAVMEKYLKGVPGKILSEMDAGGRVLPFRVEKRIDAQDGLNVVLTIDETIQYITQNILEKAIDDYKVEKGAVAIVMDPRNGDILSMVSKPDYDLNDPYAPPQWVDPVTWKGSASNNDVDILRQMVWRNKNVLDTYEPGSTFKTITSASGIEEGVVTPDTMVNDYPIKLSGWTISCWRLGRPHGEETFREGVYNSCNPVFVKVAQSLGIEKFYGYVRSFGFFSKTGIEVPKEEIGVTHPKPTEIDMAVASFGQRLTVTPIQLITAYTAVANGGKLMKPRLVKELTDAEGNIVKRFEPECIRTVISQKTSQTLLDILEGVVSEGTGSNAYVEGYRVAGKTGTSQTTQDNIYIASFAAIAPADNPVICALVVLFDPKGESYMGGVIAAPTAGKLVEEVLTYIGVERRYTERDKEMMLRETYVPDIRNMTVADAVKKLAEHGLEYRVEGDAANRDAIVLEQTPKPGASLTEKSIVILYTYKPAVETKVAVPNVLNKTIDEASKALKDVGLNIKITGMGTAVKQLTEPGEIVTKGEVIEVDFKYVDNVE